MREQLDSELASTTDSTTHHRQTLNQRLAELSTKEDHYLDLVGDPDWPKHKITDRIVTIRTERDKILTQLVLQRQIFSRPAEMPAPSRRSGSAM